MTAFYPICSKPFCRNLHKSMQDAVLREASSSVAIYPADQESVNLKEKTLKKVRKRVQIIRTKKGKDEALKEKKERMKLEFESRTALAQAFLCM